MLVTADAGPATSVGHLWLTDFRCLREIDVELASGLTVLQGANGQGKTSLLEAVGWVARARSFRGVSDAMLVRAGATRGHRAGRGHHRAAASSCSRPRSGSRAAIGCLCNRQPVARARDLHGLLRVTVFAPDDLTLVKGGPSERRDFLDELLAMLAARYDAARSDFERVLKQRNALLRSGSATTTPASPSTCSTSSSCMPAPSSSAAGSGCSNASCPPSRPRTRCSRSTRGPISATYVSEVVADAVDRRPTPTRSRTCLREALERRRRAEIDRGLTLVGPHRDELHLMIDGLDARHQASQGEQRTLALALRLAGHLVVRELAGAAPVLLLDDVFSELDAQRAAALVRNLPPGQTLLTTAGALAARCRRAAAPCVVRAGRSSRRHEATVVT